MAYLSQYTQAPFDYKTYGIDWSAWLGEEEGITFFNYLFIESSPDSIRYAGLDPSRDRGEVNFIVDEATVLPNFKKVLFNAGRGQAGMQYDVTFIIRTNLNQYDTQRVRFVVRAC